VEALDDPRNPLAVEVLAGDHDDATLPELEGAWQNASVPEGHDRLRNGGDIRWTCRCSPPIEADYGPFEDALRPFAVDRKHST